MTQSIRILHLEDNVRDARTIFDLLDAQGDHYKIVTAGDQKQFEEAIAQGPFDIILSDFNLADFDGLSALKVAKQRLPEIPVIIVSGTMDSEDAVLCLKAGATDYLLKERLERLPSAIDRALDESRVQKQRQEAEARLRVSEARNAEQAKMLSSVRDAVIAHSLDQRIFYWNAGAERLYGWTAQEAIGRYANELLYTGAKKFAPMEEILRVGEWRGELPQRNKDGLEFTVEAFKSLLSDESGNPTGVLSINTDITERKKGQEAQKKLEAQLFQSQKMEAIGHLAGGVAHDFNNQLNIMVGYAGMLMTKLDQPKLKEYAGRICTAVQRSSALTKNLLAFARKGQNQTIPVNVHTIIVETIEMLDRTIDKRIEIKHLFNARSDVVIGDPSQLQNALLNLGVNARDAMPAGGTLLFETENVEFDADYLARYSGEIQAGFHLKISVSDTGTGMTEEVKKHLFEPFLLPSLWVKVRDWGWHPYMVRSKATRAYWKLTVSLGHGTTFKLYLPLAEQHDAELDKSLRESPSAMMKAVKGLRVLLVEDEEILRMMLTDMLTSAGI